VAVAHTILQLSYAVLRTGQPYRERQMPPLSPEHKERLIRHHVRKLGKLGVQIHSHRPAPAQKSRATEPTSQVVENK
jgi:hypothetical protein